jgi:iron complex transport system substrate-binding protein
MRFLLGGKALIPLACLFSFLSLAACGPDSEKTESFMNIGLFAVTQKDGYIEARDGAGRVLALVPRGGQAPEGFPPTMVVEVPVKRVIVYRAFEVGILKALGEADTLVGLLYPKDKWYIDEVTKGFDEGRIAFVGTNTSLDYERIKIQNPELVLTWDPSIIPMMDELGIPVVVTSTPVATCLNTQMRFVNFIAPFFGREKEAEEYFDKVNSALLNIQKTTRELPKPKVMWGDIYEKRVLVEPGNAWVAELVGLAQSDYLFDDVYGVSCIEISTERFLYSGADADIYFTYRTPLTGASSKAALARTNPLIKEIKPLSGEGRAYAPLPHYTQSSDKLDELLTEISAIIHPDAYPGHQLKYFLELPESDPGDAPGPAPEEPRLEELSTSWNLYRRGERA